MNEVKCRIVLAQKRIQELDLAKNDCFIFLNHKMTPFKRYDILYYCFWFLKWIEEKN